MSGCSTDVQQSSSLRCWGLHAQIFSRIEQQRGEILYTDWTTGPTSFVSILCTLALGTRGGASNTLFHVLLSLQSLWNLVVLHISFKERKSFTQVKWLQELHTFQGQGKHFWNIQMCKHCINSSRKNNMFYQNGFADQFHSTNLVHHVQINQTASFKNYVMLLRLINASG